MLKVRALEDADEPEVLALLQRVYGSWPQIDTSVSPSEHLAWKLRPPGSAGHIIAEAGGAIIGCVLIIPRNWTWFGASARAYQGVDVAVDPAYRDTGTMKAMLMELVRSIGVGFDFEYGALSRHPTMRRATTAAGATRTSMSLNALTHSIEKPAVPSMDDRYAIEPTDSFDADWNSVWQKALSTFDAAGARISAGLNWRYCDRGGGEFAVRLARLDQHVVGYSALRISRGTGYIADILSDRPPAVAALLYDAVQELHRQGAKQAELWLPAGHPYESITQDCGFHAANRHIELSFGPLAIDEDSLALLTRPGARVHITAGDTDLV